MSPEPPLYHNPEFDQYAENYDAALAKGLSVSGESKEYFAEKRVQWLGACLQKLGFSAGEIVDFGCGTGSATPYLLKLAGANSVLGLEVSAHSLKIAEERYGGARVKFVLTGHYHPRAEVDLVVCNGVFHHIPVEDRGKTAKYLFEMLRPGGVFSLWENNPWNPGTRYVMSRIPFDKNAITLSHLQSKRVLCDAGFEILRTDFLFIFPRALKIFRPFEAMVTKLPLGAQYQILARKP
jgi:trans-aconitate methyltransferase